MALFKSSNPALGVNTFKDLQRTGTETEYMTIQGTVNKTAFLGLVVVVAASYTWNMFNSSDFATVQPWVIGGAIGGLITAIVLVFNNGEAIQHVVFYLGLYLTAFFFFDWFWRHGGQTLGMRAWRLKVEGIEHEKITFKQSATRYFAGSFLFGFSMLSILISARSQALHDMVSKTKIRMNYK